MLVVPKGQTNFQHDVPNFHNSAKNSENQKIPNPANPTRQLNQHNTSTATQHTYLELGDMEFLYLERSNNFVDPNNVH